MRAETGLAGSDATWNPNTPDPAPDRAAPGSELSTVDPAAYRIERELARGSIGQILVAEDTRLERPVALKQLLDSRKPGARRRFVREAEITARLQHPGIVPVYEAGHWPDGRPFYAMRLVRGETLDAVVSATATLDQRLALLPHVIAVADAVAYAHSSHVIHRDLKPANILVGGFGETVVVDWGLAKRLGEGEPGSDGASGEQLDATAHGVVLGTPAYMPPEQARGEPVDARADVYALGGVLYFLLAGRAPFVGTPVAVLEAVLVGAPDPLEPLAPGAPPELVAIVHKAMAQDRARRYAHAGELAEDLKRFQTGQLVGAHRYTPVERSRRFVRAHRGKFAVVGAVALGLLASASVVLGRLDDALTRERARADELTILQARVALDADPAESLRWLSTLSAGSPRLGEARAVAAEATSRLRSTADPVDLRLDSPVASLAQGGAIVAVGQGGEVLRRAASGAWTVLRPGGDRGGPGLAAVAGEVALATRADHALDRFGAGGVRALLTAHTDRVVALAASPDGRWFASAGADGRLVVWPSAGSAEPLGAVTAGPWRAVLFLPDGTLVAGGADGDVRRFGVGPGGVVEREPLGRHPGGVTALAADPGGRWVASAGADRAVRIVDPTSGAARGQGSTSAPTSTLAASPDGRWLAGGDVTAVWLYDTAAGAESRWLGPGGVVSAVASSPDGRSLAVGSADRAVTFLDLDTRASWVARHDGEVTDLAWLPDGTLFSASGDGTVRRWRDDLPRDPVALEAALDAWAQDLLGQ